MCKEIDENYQSFFYTYMIIGKDIFSYFKYS